MPCHDSIGQYHTVARTTTGDCFHAGFATCLDQRIATVTCLLFGTEFSLLAACFTISKDELIVPRNLPLILLRISPETKPIILQN